MPNSFKYLYLFIFFIAYLPQSQAQLEDLTRDTDFFQDQTTVYQRWLDHSGLGQYLQVYDIEVKEDMLSLYLEFPFTDVDSIQSAWMQLQNDFAAQSGLSLEEQLFYKASFIMEVRQSMVNVQLYDTYDLRKEPLFMRAIYFENGQLALDESNPRAEHETITFSPTDMSDNKQASLAEFRQRYSRSNVYDCIYEYAEQRFGQHQCYDRNPEVRLLQNNEHLMFEITDLCREVLGDEVNPILCRILDEFGYDCNWVKREMLRFTISYEETLDGFRIRIELDGKYGSGFYNNVRRGGYIDMEVDFDEYLEDYSDEFSTTLQSVLKNCKK